jgi:hypothetical protein
MHARMVKTHRDTTVGGERKGRQGGCHIKEQHVVASAGERLFGQ